MNLQPDTKGIVGTVMVLLSIAAIVAMWNDWLPANAVTAITIMVMAGIGGLLMVDDRRPQ